MTPIEFEEVVDWIEARWPSTKSYQRWEDLAADFGQIPQSAALSVIQDHYDQGQAHPLSSSQLRKLAGRLAYERGKGEDPQNTECAVRGFHGVWAITTNQTYYGAVPHDEGLGTLPPGFREGTCVICGMVVRDHESKMLTVGETEQ